MPQFSANLSMLFPERPFFFFFSAEALAQHGIGLVVEM